MVTFERVAKAEREKVKALSALASAIVKEHYDPILGTEQNDYMIEKFQSVTAIDSQFEHGYNYFFVVVDGERVGFIGLYPREGDLYLSKFYLRKDKRGHGYGKIMFSFVVEQAKLANKNKVTLNVNKYNSAVHVYEALGLKRAYAEVNDIGRGYVMDDYVYEYEF